MQGLPGGNVVAHENAADIGLGHGIEVCPIGRVNSLQAGQRRSRSRPGPVDILLHRQLGMFSPMNIAILDGEATLPFCTQPEVPDEMPKVWLPEVPLVVTASTCGTMPD